MGMHNEINIAFMAANCTKKNLLDPYNHDGVITYREPDIPGMKSSGP